MLSISVLGSEDGSISQPFDVNDFTLTIEPDSGTHVLGFLMAATGFSFLDPGPITITGVDDTPVDPVFSNPDHSGRESLLLAELSPGQYEVEVRGDGATVGDYRIDVFLPGDLGHDGMVDDWEMLCTTAAVIQNQGGWNHVTELLYRQQGIDLREDQYREALDGNLDGVVDSFDLGQVDRNYGAPAVTIGLVGDDEPPQVAAWLADDTGRSDSDGITADATIAGTITDASTITSLRGGFGNTPQHQYVDLLAYLNGDQLELDAAALATIPGSPPPDGTYTLSLIAEDEYGNAPAAPATVTFTLIADNDQPTVANPMGPLAATEDAGLVVDIAGVFADADLPLGDNLELTAVDIDNSLIEQVSLASNTLAADTVSLEMTVGFVPDAVGSGSITLRATDALGAFIEHTIQIDVAAVNDAPSFYVNAGDHALEDAGLQLLGGFAWNISPGGGPDEAAQTLQFLVTTDNDALFADLPAINPATGNLTYTPAGDANGTATVTVELRDDGGTANGGLDTSAPQTFQIEVVAVNDVPTFDLGPDQMILEDAGPQTVADFVTNLSPGGGPDESGQNLNFLTSTDNDALFAVLPQIDPATGDLTYVPTDDANGTATVTVQLVDDGGTENGGVDTSAPQTFQIQITAINDAPSFVVGPDQSVVEDSGPQSVAGFAASISPGGGPDEGGQTLDFLLSTDNDALFAVLPQIDPATGELTYTPADDANGTVTVTVELTDDGGTANGGVDTAAPQTFQIEVRPVNDAPTFDLGPDQTVLEDSGLQTVVGFATNMSSGGGPDEAGQALQFVTDTSNDALFAVLPQIDPASGELTYTLADDAAGTATVSVGLTDDGGIADGGEDTSAPQTFEIEITSVNDAPSFDVGPDQTVLEDAGPQTVGGFASNVSPGGGPDEAGQTLTFTVGNDNAALFAVEPQIAADGTLSYTPADDANGMATVTVQLGDDGGTADGGVDTSAEQVFQIHVTAVNDPPTFDLGPDQNVLEDAGPQTVPGFATNMSPGGGPDEAGQTLDLDAITDNPGLFALQPSISTLTGNLKYTPADDAFGTATVAVQLVDTGGSQNGGSDSSPYQTFHITIEEVNDPPTAVDDLDLDVVNTEATTLQVLANDEIFPDVGETLKIIWVSAATNGVVEISPDEQSLIYTPTPGLPVDTTDTFEYTIEDNRGLAGLAPATVTVVFVDNSVNAVADDYDVNDGILEDGGPYDLYVLANDSDDQGDGFQVDSVTQGDQGGTVDVGPGGAYVIYDPAENFFGVEHFSYTIEDDRGAQSTAQVTVDVAPVNDAPSFLLPVGPDQEVLEDAGAQVVADFASDVSTGGGAFEAGQVLNFVVSTDNDALFAVLPQIDPATGDLTYTPAGNDVNGSATVTVQLADDGGTANGGVDASAEQTFLVNVVAVNDAPSFDVGPDQVVLEDAGLQVVNGFATNISPGGGPDEGSQFLEFQVTTDNDALFTVLPQIDSGSGELTYTPAGNANGLATVTVLLVDDGGGADTSAPQTFDVTVGAVNDAPLFDVGPGQSVLEDAGPQVVAAFATNISPGGGPDEAGQVLNFVVSTDNDALFAVLPQIDPATGDLTYTAADDANGTATVTVTLSDDGGTPNGGSDTSLPQTFDIQVGPVNDAPTFGLGPDQAVLEDSGMQTVAGFATNMSPGGGPDEAGQALQFTVGTDNDALFAVLPQIDSASGELTYTPAGDANGTAIVTVLLVDDGGTADGGVDTSAPQTFDIEIGPVNDAPSFDVGPDQSVLEDAGPQVVAGFATNISPGGGPDEAGQVLDFVVTNDNNGLFADQPAIGAGGTLTYTTALDTTGSAIVTVVLTDDGGTADGGQDESPSQTFTISVDASPPEVVNAIDDIELTDGDPQPGLIDLSSVFHDADDDLVFTAQSSNMELVTVQIVGIDNDQLEVTYLDYAAAQDRTPAVVTVVATEDKLGGLEATDEFTVSVIPEKTVLIDLVVLQAPTPEAQAEGSATLPTSVNEVTTGATFYVEIWMTDLLTAAVTDGPISEGLLGSFLDLNFDQALCQGVALHHEGVFESSLFAAGEVNNAAGVVEGFGGATIDGGYGIDPHHVRLGYVEFTAEGAGQHTFTLDLDDSDRPPGQNPVGLPGRLADDPAKGNVDLSQIELGSVTVTQAEALEFTVVDSEVIIDGTVDGIAFSAQQTDVSDRTTVSGTFEVVVDDLAVPESISILSSALDLDISGQWTPLASGQGNPGDVADGDFGLTAEIMATPTNVGNLMVAIRNVALSITTAGAATIDAGDSFPAASQTWQLAAGVADRHVVIPDFGNLITDDGQDLLAGYELTDNVSPASIFRETTIPGTYELQLPFQRRLEFTTNDGSDVMLNVAGHITAQYTVGAGLTATEVSPAAEGTNVSMTLVSEPTPVDAQGHAATLPGSEPWIDEWDQYWVELWVDTDQGPGISAATVDLAYQGDYFTATEIDHGSVFANNPTGTIDDLAGLVAGLGGTTLRTDAGGNGFALLGRVKFEALADDQVTVDPLGQLVGPFDLGLELTGAEVKVAGVGSVEATLGRAPGTELWAVPYDVDDNDQVDLGDLAYFAEAFQQDALSSELPLARALDFDSSGRIDLGDLTYLAENFGGRKGSGAEVRFPADFPRQWIGPAIDVRGATSVDRTLSAAVEAWQQALDAPEPVEVQLVVRDFGDSQLGEAAILELDEAGRPVRGIVTIDDDAAGLGWYSDPEAAPPAGRYDLYTTLLHEVGHVLGFTPAYGGFQSHVETGPDGGPVFVGPEFSVPLDATAQHVWVAPDDLMAPELGPGQRRLPSGLDVEILQTSYEAASTGFAPDAAALYAVVHVAPASGVTSAGSLGLAELGLGRVDPLFGAAKDFLFAQPASFGHRTGLSAGESDRGAEIDGLLSDLAAFGPAGEELFAHWSWEKGRNRPNESHGAFADDFRTERDCPQPAELPGLDALDAALADWEA